GLIYIRGQKQDYDRWEQQGNTGWSWNDCLPYFRKLENNDLGESPTRGTTGPLNATSIKTKHPLVEALIQSAATLGLKKRQDFNSGDQEGVGYYQLTTRNGKRCSTAVAYLNPARGRSNLRIETDAQATIILMQGNRASGIRYRKGGVEHTLLANREVILSAGSIQSPQLLQLSGIGPSKLLNQFGIPVVKDLNGVGKNLQDHLQTRLIYEVTKPITTNDQLRTIWSKSKIGLQWLLFRSGPLAIGINQGAIFCRALPEESATPDIQFHFGTLSADAAGGAVHDFSGCTYSVCQLRPESRGEINIKSTDPFEAPSMQPNYLSTDLDRRTAIAGVKYARRLAACAPMSDLMKSEHRPGADIRTDDEILHFCREYGATIFHPTGTAKMGLASDTNAVVDNHLRVHGIDGLRVVDASIMPTLVSGNTNVPIVMIAERAAEFILEDAKRKHL
ncbi:MAG: GMC family oxidoreductase N-terminal domain-containing protein, partial [Paralcaligenes sp.]